VVITVTWHPHHGPGPTASEASVEEFVRAHNQVIVYVGLVYVRCLHPPLATVLRMYLGSDFAVRWWCEGLASVKELPWVQTAGARLAGVDALLLVCKG
jgi:hypothetical protein